MAATDPTLSGEATLLIIQIDNTLLKGRMWARDVASGGQRSEEYAEDARAAHAIAMRQTSALLGLVWKRAGGVGEMHYPTRPCDG